jgi:ferredoxin
MDTHEKISGSEIMWTILAILYCYGAVSWVDNVNAFSLLMASLPGILLVAAAYPAWGPVLDYILLLSFLLAFQCFGVPGDHTCFMALILYTSVILLSRWRSKLSVLALAGVAALFYTGQGWWITNAYMHLAPLSYFVIACCAVTIVIFAVQTLSLPGKKPLTVDLILTSYSGNTAHYALAFAESARMEGAVVNTHRLHRTAHFKPELKGDSLAVAFPAVGWKCPWPLAWYILRDLPAGKGKPALILYTAGGGPENAGVFTWLLLTLRGYCVTGRLWAVYPVNVPTFRIGPAALWKWLDSLLPRRCDMELVKRAARSFVHGRGGGFPLLVFPFFMIVAGILLDNRGLNMLLYRHYVWRWRCTRCGRCTRVCPTGRQFMGKDGFPTARGECIICLCCINLCPAYAMHMLAFTEYGNPYRPRWPELAGGNEEDKGNDAISGEF